MAVIWAVAGASYAVGHLDTQSVRKALVDYRHAVANWQSRTKEFIARVQEDLGARESSFSAGFLQGRTWLADAYADLFVQRDATREFILRTKPHPGISSANVVREVKAEKRLLAVENRWLRMQLASYEEYFPELVDYRELILDEAEEFIRTEAFEDIDPVLRYLTSDEYRALTPAERNQRALDRYRSRPKTDWEIGRYYER